MITTISIFGCKCDNCGREFESEVYGCAQRDREVMEELVSDDDTYGEGWATINGNHFCPSCWTWDEDMENKIAK